MREPARLIYRCGSAGARELRHASRDYAVLTFHTVADTHTFVGRKAGQGVVGFAWTELPPPPELFDAQLLVDAITVALPKATVPAEDQDANPYAWGAQHEVRALDLGQDAREAARVAGYIAKYATKSTEDAGGVGARIEHAHELGGLRCREHARRLITGAWQAGEHEYVDSERMRRWAHQFGFSGHCFTKSRRFSTTFKALREARATHAASCTLDAGKTAAK